MWQRVEQYGITERRYLLGVLALWLGAVALYSAITRTRRIRHIPFILAVLGAVTFVGPWSAYAVAQRSQLARLTAILSQHDALLEGRVSQDVVEIPFEAWTEARSVVEYLVREHGAALVSPLLADGEAGRPVPGAAASADTLPREALALPQAWTRDAARLMDDLRIRPGVSDRPARLEAIQQGAPISAEGFDLLLVGDAGDEAVIGADTLRFALSAGGMEILVHTVLAHRKDDGP